jgi:hypothetical protein
MTPQMFATVLREAGPERFLLQQGNDHHNAFHFLKYRSRTGVNGSDVPARTDPAIAELFVGVAEIEPTFVQLLLQQAAAHAFAAAAERLIDDYGADIDKPSEYDDRTPRSIGQQVRQVSTHALFDRSHELEQELEEERRRSSSQLERHDNELGEHRRRSSLQLEQTQHELHELHAVFERKDQERLAQIKERRCAVFRETMIAGGLLPFSLAAGGTALVS